VISTQGASRIGEGERLTVTRAKFPQTAAGGSGASPASLTALRVALEERLDELTGTATELIFAEVPSYRASDGSQRPDVHAHVRSHLDATLRAFGDGRPVTREQLLFLRRHAARRIGHIPIADFVNAFYVGERVLWEAALELAVDDESRRAALAFATHLPRYFEVATTHAAEVYLEAEEQLAATGERIRRDLLEDLFAGVPIDAGSRLEAARAAGLKPGSRCVVISATTTAPGDDEQLLRSAAASLARACGGALAPLTVVRHGEIDLVVPVAEDSVGALQERLANAQRRLESGGVPLAIGISTVVAGLEQVADAYREAETARHALGPTPGILALPGMTAFDYLTLGHDPTAGRLIAPAIRQFVFEDARQGGVLIKTLREYLACDLNARRAAAQLHIHVNTAHYRLGRIAERTGCDLHRVADLIEILIAARLVDLSIATEPPPRSSRRRLAPRVPTT
jgi:hypothetical protein